MTIYSSSLRVTPTKPSETHDDTSTLLSLNALHLRSGWVLKSWYAISALAVVFNLYSNQVIAKDLRSDTLQLLSLPWADLLNIRITSATKRPNEIRDIPASVTVIDRKDIESYGYTTLTDLLKNIPGLYLFDTTANIRIGSRGSADGEILFLINGISVQPPTKGSFFVDSDLSRMNIPIESIDRIEFTRGPMSVMYGNNAFSGVINIVTNQLNSDNEHQISASQGNNKQEKLFLRLQKTFNDGYLLLNGGHYQTNGYDGRYSDMISSDSEITYTHPSMDGLMDQQYDSLDLSMAYMDLTAEIRYSKIDYGFHHLYPPENDGSRTELETFNTALSFDHSFNDQLSARLTGIYSTEEYDNYQLDIGGPGLDGYNKKISRRKEIEFNIIYSPIPELDALAGYRYREMSGYDEDVVTIFRGNNINEIYTNIDPYKNWSLFGQVGYNLSTNLRVVSGLRMTREPDQYSARLRVFSSGVLLNDEIVMTKADDRTSYVGQIAGIYTLDENHIFKLMHGTATQDSTPGGSSTRPKSEKSTTTEFNYVFSSNNLLLNASLFHTEFKNMYYRNVDTTNRIVAAFNDGRQSIYGIEIMGQAPLTKNLSLDTSLTWQYNRDKNRDTIADHAPRLLFKSKLSYRQRSITYSTNIHYVDEMRARQPFNDVLRDDVGSYWNVSANIRYQNPEDAFYLNLNASNLLDEEIRYPGNTDMLDLDRNLIGPRRSIMLTAGLKF
ncbi:MAG: TonB-dependent receptor [Candidatus Thiodiazotropha endolucinida]